MRWSPVLEGGEDGGVGGGGGEEEGFPTRGGGDDDKIGSEDPTWPGHISSPDNWYYYNLPIFNNETVNNNCTLAAKKF